MKGSGTVTASPLIYPRRNTDPNFTSATSSATDNHDSSNKNSTKTHHCLQLSYQRCLPSERDSAQEILEDQSRDSIRIGVNGSLSLTEYSWEASNTYHLILPTGCNSAWHASTSNAFHYRDSGCYSTIPLHTNTQQQNYNSPPYAMRRWLSENRYEGPYHAFVAVIERQHSPGVIIPEDHGDGIETEGCEEPKAPIESGCDNGRGFT
ncbi:hypothetical protein O1611_g2469 [Lasiodiplodia mahajangana]|uniref:Uncharacterized protein n=1 Tax=Lasiodiplodia mahajangana TaxID=1108764 RepID=A0ACC2JV56_9PEZI|nr:hypothetical protein O1611_g2469 [Lasiodiplodia mahajangana]